MTALPCADSPTAPSDSDCVPVLAPSATQAATKTNHTMSARHGCAALHRPMRCGERRAFMSFNASRARRIRPAGQPESLRYGQPVGARSGERLDLGGQLSADVARVDRVAWLEQELCGLGVGARTVLGPAGHDEQLPRPQDHVAISHLDGELAAEHEGRYRVA